MIMNNHENYYPSGIFYHGNGQPFNPLSMRISSMGDFPAIFDPPGVFFIGLMGTFSQKKMTSGDFCPEMSEVTGRKEDFPKYPIIHP